MEATAWCILTTTPAQTLNLAASLNDSGIRAWTPVELVQREHARRSNKRVDVEVPIMPRFVFADFGRVRELLELSHSPALLFRVWDSARQRMIVKGHPSFRVFGNGMDRPIDDRALAHLRLVERRQRPKQQVRQFGVGESVKLTEGGFEGLTGIVEKIKGSHTFVRFPGSAWLVQIPTWVLISAIDETPVYHVGKTQALVAKAA